MEPLHVFRTINIVNFIHFYTKSLVVDSGGETQSPPLLNHYVSDACMISGGHFIF